VKNYYQILRISPHATPTEIKRAYRRLAVVFHPDKNSSPEALQLFQEINEAHQVLSDPFSRRQYDDRLNQPVEFSTAQTTRPDHRDPAYRRRHTPGYRPPPRQPSERLLMMVHFLKYLRLICFAGIGWCGALLVDYSLPFRISDETVLSEANRIYSWQYHHVPYVLVTSKAHQFPLPAEGVDYFKVGSVAHVFSSRVLNIMVKVESEDHSYVLDSLASIYQTFIFVPGFLLVLSVIGLTLEKGIEFRFSFAIVILTIMFFNLIFLLFSIL